MKIKLLFLIFFALLPSVMAGAAEDLSLSLGEAVTLALRDNREVLLQAEELKKAKAKIAQARADLMPSLTFTGSWLYNREFYDKDIVQTATQFSLKQYLYKGGKTINTIKYNGYNFEIAQAILDKTKLDLAFNAQKAFYAFLLASEFRDLNKKILDNTQAHLVALQERYEKGQSSESQVLKIKESLAGVQEAYESSLNQVEASTALLKNLLYIDDKVQLSLQGEFQYEPRDFAFDEAFLKAMHSRTEIRQYEAQIKAAEKAIGIAKADARPSIYASWDYYNRSHTSFVAARNWNDYNIIGLNISWPIFDGLLTKAKVDQALVDLKQAQLTKEKTIKDIAFELKNAYSGLKNAVAKLTGTESEIKVYADNLKVATQQHKNGLASSLDLDDANLSYAVSLFNKIQATYDYIIAKLGFEKATGG